MLENENKARRTPLFPQKSCNVHNISSLQDCTSKTGTQTGQNNSSLYDTIQELCKEKKMSLLKAEIPYIGYLPAKLTQGKEWYISYSVRDPFTSKLKRIRKKVNYIKCVKQRLSVSKRLIQEINTKLMLGWNPLVENIAPRAYAPMFDILDLFLSVKSKEMEKESMRCYSSYVKIIKNWLSKQGYDNRTYVSCFNFETATTFLTDLDADPRISARTYNNYLVFCRTLFNWLCERSYIRDNPFSAFKKKSRKLTKKTRRPLSENEVQRLFDYLEKENKEYLVMCMLCYYCFMRPKEIVLLKVSDIDIDKQVVNVRAEIAKNDNDSVRTIPDAMISIIKALKLPKHGNDYLFSDGPGYTFKPGKKLLSSRKMAKYWSDHIRPALNYDMEIQFYSLKDTGITSMINAGVPIPVVQHQADHSSIEMTAIYVAKRKDELIEEIKNISGI